MAIADDSSTLHVRAVGGSPQPTLGRRLRAIRLHGGESLSDVARATEISASFLSMVETGSSDISLGRLLRLTQHYGIEIGDIVCGVSEAEPAVERPSLNSRREGLTIEFLADPLRPLRPLLVCFEPRGGMVEPVENSGDAFLYVLEGELQVEVAGENARRLRQGESTYLPGERPRLYRNPTELPTRLLSVVLRREVIDGSITNDR